MKWSKIEGRRGIRNNNVLAVHGWRQCINFIIYQKLYIMAPSEKIKLYFFVKNQLEEDLSKEDIRELSIERFGRIPEKEFNSAYSEAFGSIN